MARPSECGHESGIQADKQEDLARQTDSSIQSAKVSILCGQLIVRLWDRARASVRLSKEQSSFDRACLPARSALKMDLSCRLSAAVAGTLDESHSSPFSVSMVRFFSKSLRARRRKYTQYFSGVSQSRSRVAKCTELQLPYDFLARGMSVRE